MRETRQHVRRLWVLGAGASFAATQGDPGSAFRAPLDVGFTKRLLKPHQKKPNWIRETADWIAKAWIDHKPLADCGLEEAINKQLSHTEFLYATHPKRKRYVKDPDEFMLRMSHLITASLLPCRESSSRLLGRIADSVIAQYEGGWFDAVATFNYDTLIDKHFLDVLSPHLVYFDRIKTGRSAPERKREQLADTPLLLKLHGSVNWRCEETDYRSAMRPSVSDTRYRIPSIWMNKQRSIPGESESPLIIPPLSTKPIMSTSIFHFLWQRAYEYLMETEELCICGYSLPPTDQMAMSLFSSFKSKNLQRVVIADPNPEVWSRYIHPLHTIKIPIRTKSCSCPIHS